MSDKVKVSVDSRESERREIERQVQEFLSRGGSIKQLPQTCVNAKPIGKVWRPSFGFHFE